MERTHRVNKQLEITVVVSSVRYVVEHGEGIK